MGKRSLIVRGCGMGRETGLVHYCLRFFAEPRNDTAVGGGPRGWADVTDWQYGVLPPLILREPPASADLRQHERPSPKATTRDCHYGGGDGFLLGGRNDERKSGRDDGGAGGMKGGRGTGMTGGGGCRVTTRGWHCGVTLRSTLRYAKGALLAHFRLRGSSTGGCSICDRVSGPTWGWIHAPPKADFQLCVPSVGVGARR